MIKSATPSEARANLRRRAKERGFCLTELAVMLSRHESYLKHYVELGSPEALHEDDRLCLAQLLMIDERELGARDPWMPTH